MPKLVLDQKEIEVLEIEFGEETYKIPLGTELTRKELAELSDDDKIMEWFEQFIPAEVLDTIPYKQIIQIIKTWSKATEDASGLKLGELSASRNSRRNTARR